MRIYSAAAREFWLGTALATRTFPVAAPPLTADAFDPNVLVGADLIYLCLHGLPNQPYLYGDGFETAITAEQVRSVHLDGAVVYMAGCYGDGKMADAFLDAGAGAVVGDVDTTWAGTWWPMGSNRLGRLFVQSMRRGYPIETAYARAKRAFRATAVDRRDIAILDTVRLRLAGSTMEVI